MSYNRAYYGKHRDEIKESAREAEKKRYWRDRIPSKPGPKPKGQIEMGLALLSAFRYPGTNFSCNEIGAWCGVSGTAIQKIERRALMKVRERLRLRFGMSQREMIEEGRF